MNFIKKLLLFLLGLVVIVTIIMFAIGKKYHFEITKTIDAPIEQVYAQASSSKMFNTWNPWMDLDPNLSVTYTGEQGQVGDTYCWEGNDNVGQGCHIITELVVNQKVATKMEFKKPFESDATSDIVLRAEGSKTVLTWSMDCELDYPMNLMKLMMDANMKESYGKGLNKLKEIVEKK